MNSVLLSSSRRLSMLVGRAALVVECGELPQKDLGPGVARAPSPLSGEGPTDADQSLHGHSSSNRQHRLNKASHLQLQRLPTPRVYSPIEIISDVNTDLVPLLQSINDLGIHSVGTWNRLKLLALSHVGSMRCNTAMDTLCYLARHDVIGTLECRCLQERMEADFSTLDRHALLRVLSALTAMKVDLITSIEKVVRGRLPKLIEESTTAADCRTIAVTLTTYFPSKGALFDDLARRLVQLSQNIRSNEALVGGGGEGDGGRIPVFTQEDKVYLLHQLSRFPGVSGTIHQLFTEWLLRPRAEDSDGLSREELDQSSLWLTPTSSNSSSAAPSTSSWTSSQPSHSLSPRSTTLLLVAIASHMYNHGSFDGIHAAAKLYYGSSTSTDGGSSPKEVSHRFLTDSGFRTTVVGVDRFDFPALVGHVEILCGRLLVDGFDKRFLQSPILARRLLDLVTRSGFAYFSKPAFQLSRACFEFLLRGGHPPSTFPNGDYVLQSFINRLPRPTTDLASTTDECHFLAERDSVSDLSSETLAILLDSLHRLTPLLPQAERKEFVKAVELKLLRSVTVAPFRLLPRIIRGSFRLGLLRNDAISVVLDRASSPELLAEVAQPCLSFLAASPHCSPVLAARFTALMTSSLAGPSVIVSHVFHLAQLGSQEPARYIQLLNALTKASEDHGSPSPTQCAVVLNSLAKAELTYSSLPTPILQLLITHAAMLIEMGELAASVVLFKSLARLGVPSNILKGHCETLVDLAASTSTTAPVRTVAQVLACLTKLGFPKPSNPRLFAPLRVEDDGVGYSLQLSQQERVELYKHLLCLGDDHPLTLSQLMDSIFSRPVDPREADPPGSVQPPTPAETLAILVHPTVERTRAPLMQPALLRTVAQYAASNLDGSIRQHIFERIRESLVAILGEEGKSTLTGLQSTAANVKLPLPNRADALKVILQVAETSVLVGHPVEEAEGGWGYLCESLLLASPQLLNLLPLDSLLLVSGWLVKARHRLDQATALWKFCLKRMDKVSSGSAAERPEDLAHLYRCVACVIFPGGGASASIDSIVSKSQRAPVPPFAIVEVIRALMAANKRKPMITEQLCKRVDKSFVSCLTTAQIVDCIRFLSRDAERANVGAVNADAALLVLWSALELKFDRLEQQQVEWLLSECSAPQTPFVAAELVRHSVPFISRLNPQTLLSALPLFSTFDTVIPTESWRNIKSTLQGKLSEFGETEHALYRKYLRHRAV